MFYKCSSLKRLNLSSFKTDNVIDMRGMFYECKSLQELDISNFNTNKVNKMSHMFNKCSSLQELNLENIKIDKVNDTTGIFEKCQSYPSLKIKCSEELKKKIKDIGYQKLFKKMKKNSQCKNFIKTLKPSSYFKKLDFSLYINPSVIKV